MMRFRNLLSLVAAAVVAVGILGAPNRAQAGFQVRISTDGGANFTTVVDGGLGDESPGLANDITITSTSPLLPVALTLQATTNPDGSALDLKLQGTASVGSYNLIVQASVDGITLQSPKLTYSLSGTVTGQSGLTRTMRTFLDDDNNLFGLGSSHLVAATGTVPVGTPLTTTAPLPVTAPYSMTTEITFVGNVAVLPFSPGLDSNNTLVATPAPAGLVLAVTGLPVFGFGAWFRRRRA